MHFKNIAILSVMFCSYAHAYSMPSEEEKFISIVQQGQIETANAVNDMQLAGIKARRNDTICSDIKHGPIKNWYGKVKNTESSNNGKGVVIVEIAKNIYFKTWNNAFSDKNFNTLIDPRSEVFKNASMLVPGDVVKFSGRLFNGGENCIREGSVSLSGGLVEPEFIFKFTKIEKAITQ